MSLPLELLPFGSIKNFWSQGALEILSDIQVSFLILINVVNNGSDEFIIKLLATGTSQEFEGSVESRKISLLTNSSSVLQSILLSSVEILLLLLGEHLLIFSGVEFGILLLHILLVLVLFQQFLNFLG